MPDKYAITCRFGRLGSVEALPTEIVDLLKQEIPNNFVTGSAGTIEMTLEDANFNPRSYRAGQQVASAQLHPSLRDITGNPRTGELKTIGLLFAGKYSFKPGIFGIMFDRGFTTSDDGNSVYTGLPREGCAVFLDAIAESRVDPGSDRHTSSEFRNEVLFVSTHELGHVFNLGHLEDGKSFMSTSRVEAPLPQRSFKFSNGHQGILCRCSESEYVRPGGSAWGVLGPEIPRSEGGDYGYSSEDSPTRDHSALRLKISVATPSFYYNQAVELDISLSLRDGSTRAVSVPDRLDCGYAAFNVWIEDPDREVRLYRPTNQYCSPLRMIKIALGMPFQRDMSLFGQSGGYTFSKTGVHRLWAEFRVSPSAVVRSDVIEVELLGIAGNSFRKQKEHIRMMAAAGPALFYRSQVAGKLPLEALEALTCLRTKRSILDRAAACYSLGRLAASKAIRTGRRDDRDKAIRLLERAGDFDRLGTNRMRITHEWLRRLA